MTNDTEPRAPIGARTSMDATPCRATRMRIRITLAPFFTRAQVAELMAAAYGWGRDSYAADLADAYEQGAAAERARLTELNLDAIRRALDTPRFSERTLRMEDHRARARREADIAAGVPWIGDHPGGPVIEPGWGDEGDESRLRGAA